MKIQAHSLMAVRQTMVSARALLNTIVFEGGGTPDRRRTINRRAQDLTDAIKLIDDSLGIAPVDPRAPPDSWHDTVVTKSEEVNDG